jgi:3-phenylpropionate/cinnamic acid dioxygenase small subunit
VEAEDYFAIQNLVYRYADLLDRGDLEGVGALFEHAEVYMPGGKEPMSRPGNNTMTEVFRKNNITYPETGGRLRTRHVTTNLIIEEEGPGRARTQSYFTVLQSTPDFPLQPICGGTYNDRFEKVDGAWRFCERREEMPLVGDLSHHLSIPYTGPR